MNWIEQGWRGPGISLILSPSCANSTNLYKSFFSCTMRAMVLLISQCPNFSPTYNTSYACFCSHRDGRWVCACNRWMHRCASPKKREIIEHSKEIKPVSPKGNQPWTFIGRPDAEAPILWPCDAKNQLTEKDPDPGKIEGKRRRGWQRMRWLDNIIDSMDMNLQTTGDSRGQKSLPCYHLWDSKESNTLSYWIMATHMYLWLGHKASLSSERQLELVILE